MRLPTANTSFKRDFLKYSTFRNVKREHIIPASQSENFVVKDVHQFASVLLKRNAGRFELSCLPVEAQMFPVFSFANGDFNEDGKTDVLAVGNLMAVQPDYGRYDAGYGLMLLGDGVGGFTSLPLEESGFVVTGEGRKIKTIISGSQRLIAVGRNNDSMLLFQKK